jgi:hypothetical protein
MPQAVLESITEKCPVDNTPHAFIPVVDNPPWVYCQKCLKTVEITFDQNPPDPPDPPDPQPPDDRPVKTYQASGNDDTSSLQNWINQQPSNAIYDIRGTAAINTQGLRVMGKTNVKITSTNGGGFKAIGNGAYTGPFAAMVYAEGFNDSSFDALKFNCNGKQAGGVFLCKSTRGRVLHCEAWNVAQNPAGAPWAGIYGEQCIETEIGYCHVHDTGPEVRGIWLGVSDSRRDSKPHIHHNRVERTGHSGIIAEANGPHFHDNEVYEVRQHGSAYKFIPRGPADAALFENNLAADTGNAGFMIEGSNVDPIIEVRGHVSKNCGADGTSFGGFYIVSGQGNANLNIHDCKFENCKRLGALQYVTNSQFRNMTISGNNQWSLELNNSNLTFENAGSVEMGQGNSGINVQGGATQQLTRPVVDFDLVLLIAQILRMIGKAS